MLSRGVTERDHVAVRDRIVFPLETQLTVFAARSERAAFEEPIARDYLSADEPALNIGVNRSSRENGRCHARDGPRAAFVLAHGKKRDVAEQSYAARMIRSRPDCFRPRSARNAAASAGSSAAISSSIFAQTAVTARRVARRSASPERRAGVFDDPTSASSTIHDQQKRLRRQELKPAQPMRIVAGQRERAKGAAPLEARAALDEHILLAREIGQRVLLQIFLEPFEAALNHAEVGKDQLFLNRADVACRIDRLIGMRNRWIPERADDVEQGIRVAVGETSKSDFASPRPAAMSANSTVAGTRFSGWNSVVSRSRRSSGTRDTPTFASVLPWVRGASLALVSNWKRVVLPADGSPMRPARSMSNRESYHAR